jgi:hypothetical protein
VALLRRRIGAQLAFRCRHQLGVGTAALPLMQLARQVAPAAGITVFWS